MDKLVLSIGEYEYLKQIVSKPIILDVLCRVAKMDYDSIVNEIVESDTLPNEVVFRRIGLAQGAKRFAETLQMIKETPLTDLKDALLSRGIVVKEIKDE